MNIHLSDTLLQDSLKPIFFFVYYATDQGAASISHATL